MPEQRTADVVVIGAGPVGENVAQYVVEGGLSAVLVERELLGGECSYFACMPSKALLRPVEVAETAAHLPGLERPALDVPALLRRRDDWVSHYDDTGQVDWARQSGIDVVRGSGRLVGARRVLVTGPDEDVVIEARTAVVLATGSEAIVPDLYASCAPWSSRDATGVVEVPDRIVVIGGGVVACEAATWLAALGSEVTMLVRGPRLLDRIEEFAAQHVRESLEAAGIEVRLDARVSAAHRDDARDTGLGRIHGGPVRVVVDGAEIVADELLVAAGRRPRLGDLGLESVGLDPSALPDADLPDWLHLVGDVSGEAALTHWGKYRARCLGERIAAGAGGAESPEAPPVVPVPQVVFTDPQVGSVGLTEREARDAGHEVVVADVPWTAAAGAALLRDDVSGGARLVVDVRSRLVLGATFVGPDAGELVHAATIAIVGAVPVHVLRHAVPSYPTASELWLRLLESLPVELRRAPSGRS